ncbi:MAG: hypothetical protein ACRD38_01785 [Nitrososphaerales archaeon]
MASLMDGTANLMVGMDIDMVMKTGQAKTDQTQTQILDHKHKQSPILFFISTQ